VHILTTKRCKITPLITSDFEDILNMYHEPDSNTYIPPLLNKTDQEYLDFLTMKVETNNHPKGLGFWTVRELETQKFIGTANLNVLDVLKITHMGCHLSKAVWGQGFATEIMAAMCDYGLNDLGLPTVYGICSVGHVVSKKMLLRTGLVYDKTVQLRGEDVEVFCIRK